MGNAVAIHNIQHVVIDNLQFMMGMDYSNGDRFFKQDTLIHRFRKFATNNKCHVTVVIHPRKVSAFGVGKERDVWRLPRRQEEEEELSISSIFGSAKASQESDNILIIQSKKLTAANGLNIKYLQVESFACWRKELLYAGVASRLGRIDSTGNWDDFRFVLIRIVYRSRDCRRCRKNQRSNRIRTMMMMMMMGIETNPFLCNSR